MEIRKRITLNLSKSDPTLGTYEREYIFFTVRYNHYRDVSDSIEHAVRDREDRAECECVLALPDSYRDDGEETPLILSFHGAGSRVSEQENLIGGVSYVRDAIDAGYAALDVCGSEEHGLTMGCPEHLFAAYKAYRYAVKHYNLSKTVLLAGASMGGHTAMNFANTFPSIVTAVGLIYPRLNMDGVTVDGHYCIGTWDKTAHKEGKPSTRDRIVEIYHFPNAEWYEPTTVGFNPYRTRSFVDADGKRVVIPPCPIKIWQGNADVTVDPVMVTEFVESVRRSGSYIEYHLLDGVGHKISPVMRQEMVLWFDRFI
ncbi:MAG: alpha/beta hydrolase [Clostridia bacterium]|nr:alpha/beta hydrolase [Clostridia bacterium]